MRVRSYAGQSILRIGGPLLIGILNLRAEAEAARFPEAVAGGNPVYLWWGLGCFGLAGFILFGRGFKQWLIRRRLRAMRTMWPERLGVGHWLRRMKRGRGVARAMPWPGLGWETRARRAELKAQQAVAALRSELAPHLARMMRDRLICTLMAQRARLLSVNQANAEKVAALEHRLQTIQHQIQKQAEAYESRIADLEKELNEKSLLTRELLKFRVKLARQALEAVRFDGGSDRD